MLILSKSDLYFGATALFYPEIRQQIADVTGGSFYSAQFFGSAWRQFRKRNAYPTAITQNVEYLRESGDARAMLSNSEFIVMLNQAEPDRETLSKLLAISNEQLSYITNAEPGSGLIRYGSSLVPFVNRFPKDTEIYRMIMTKPGEGAAA